MIMMVMVNMSVWKLVLDHLAVGYIHMIRKPVDDYSNLIVNSGKSLYPVVISVAITLFSCVTYL